MDHVAHFARRTRGLAVEVEGGAGIGEEGGPIGFDFSAGGIGAPEVAEEVGHDGRLEEGDFGHGRGVGRAEGEVADGGDVEFELGAGGGAQGDVAGVVRAGGEFIHQDVAVVQDEHFDREESDDAEFFRDGGGVGARGFFGGGGEAGGTEGLVEDAVAVFICEHGEAGGLAGGVAGDDDGGFGDEGDGLFEEEGLLAQIGPGAGGVGVGAEPELALAVVASAGGFGDDGKGSRGAAR